MYDISASGAVSVWLHMSPGGESFEFKPEDFADDVPPVRYAATPVADARIDFNGNLFKNTQKRPVQVELSPIPGTEPDIKLKYFLYKARDLFADDSVSVESMVISNGQYNIRLVDGTIADGNFGFNLMNDGRLGTSTYSFLFANIITGAWPLEQSKFKTPKSEKPKKAKSQQIALNPKKVGAVYYFGSASNQFN